MSSGGQTGIALATTHTNLTADIIEARARAITKRDNTSVDTAAKIDGYTLEACREISKRKLCLPSSSTGTLAVSSNTITVPSDMVLTPAAIDEFYLGDTLQDPLTFAEWRAGKMSGFAYRDGVIYVSPTANTAKSYTLYYKRYHSNSVASIELNDDYKMAIVYFVCMKLSDEYERSDKVAEYLQLYENELRKYTVPGLVATRMRSFRG